MPSQICLAWTTPSMSTSSRRNQKRQATQRQEAGGFYCEHSTHLPQIPQTQRPLYPSGPSRAPSSFTHLGLSPAGRAGLGLS